MREKLSDIISDYADFLPWETIDAIADSIIENGFTIPVRCKDCKHLEIDPGLRYDKRMCLMRGGEYGYCKDDDFCSYGERR